MASLWEHIKAYCVSPNTVHPPHVTWNDYKDLYEVLLGKKVPGKHDILAGDDILNALCTIVKAGYDIGDITETDDDSGNETEEEEVVRFHLEGHENEKEKEKHVDVDDGADCSIVSALPPFPQKEEFRHPVAAKIEQFLDDHLNHLPHHEGTHLKYASGVVKRNYWRALILSYNDRYGSGKQKAEHFVKVHSNTRVELAKLINLVHRTVVAIRKQLKYRGDKQRLQMQRPLFGRSLLSITTSKSGTHNNSLRSLYMSALHPEFGVEGFRVEKMERFPFLLPNSLQDKLPLLKPQDAHVHVSVNAPKLTMFLQQIYQACDRHSGLTSVIQPPFIDFVKRINLKSKSVWSLFGNLPEHFDVKTHGMVIKVPHVAEGNCILWKEYHATAGAHKSLNTVKATCFVDMVPSNLLTPEQRVFYRYHARYAGADMGEGSGRGGWGDFVHNVKKGSETFGLPDHIMDKFERTCKGRKRHKPPLSRQQLTNLNEQGYVIMHTPDMVQASSPPIQCMKNLSQFASHLMINSPDFDMTNFHDIQASVTRAIAKKKTNDAFFYYERRPKPGDVLNPVIGGEHTHLAQGGGSLMTKNSGLGKATSFFTEDNHVRFQFSNYVFHLMNLFYNVSEDDNTSLLVVLERFRVKTNSAWTGGTHIDTFPTHMIPPKILKDNIKHLQKTNSQSKSPAASSDGDRQKPRRRKKRIIMEESDSSQEE